MYRCTEHLITVTLRERIGCELADICVVRHSCKHTDYFKFRIYSSLDLTVYLRQHIKTVQCKLLCLNRNYNTICRCQSIDKEYSERWQTVDNNIIIFLHAVIGKNIFQDAFPLCRLHHAGIGISKSNI